MKKLVLIFLLFSCGSFAAPLPPNAIKYLPVLKKVQMEEWASMVSPPILASQIEQETCISLKHPKCWSPASELKTSREHGIGIAQFTIAYNADGSERFNKFAEVAILDKRLSSWREGKNLFDPYLQILGFVKYEKKVYDTTKFPTANDREKMAFILSEYNGGSTLKDRKLCASTQGCDSTRWFDNVEKYSFKQKTKVQGYGQSFFEINRGYVRNVLIIRINKYLPVWANL